jgi:hypothetical protein
MAFRGFVLGLHHAAGTRCRAIPSITTNSSSHSIPKLLLQHISRTSRPLTAFAPLIQIKAMSTIEKYVPKDGDAVLPLFSLKGKTAIVTGAGAGIGLAVADCLAEAGANVAFFYNSNPKAIERAEDTAQKYGVQCQWFIPHYLLGNSMKVRRWRLIQIIYRQGIQARHYLSGSCRIYRRPGGFRLQRPSRCVCCQRRHSMDQGPDS